MIKIVLSGGLGNQMFQYAFAKTLAVKHNTQLFLNTQFLESKLPIKSMATQLQYELDIFAIDAILERNIFQSKLLYPFAKANYLLQDKINQQKFHFLKETQHHFNPTYLQAKDNTYIKGNFQSEKYFIEIEEIIRKDFSFKIPLENENKSISEKIQNSNSVSIHIRRGDYISLPQNKHKFAQLSLEYYQQSIAKIKEQIFNPIFFVFSDDIAWVKQALNIDAHFISNNNTNKTAYMDMQLMSMCKHNIIANSTFSWWAAWLNNNPQKIVIAPQHWFADVSINSQDIIPTHWIKL
ncbi:MAG: alpha-1,2-fucosyltransferase [Bacteroidetes bacterium]|nr:alpha-1,2-fucosyltransferase [Bacteroidota bacterium]